MIRARTALAGIADIESPEAAGVYPLTDLGRRTLRELERLAHAPVAVVPGFYPDQETHFDG